MKPETIDKLRAAGRTNLVLGTVLRIIESSGESFDEAIGQACIYLAEQNNKLENQVLHERGESMVIVVSEERFTTLLTKIVKNKTA